MNERERFFQGRQLDQLLELAEEHEQNERAVADELLRRARRRAEKRAAQAGEGEQAA